MQIAQERKDEVEKAIVNLIANLIEKGDLAEYELGSIVEFYGAKIDASQSEEDLQAFISEFVAKWPIFSPLRTIEHNNSLAKTEKQVTQDVLDLAKEGKLDEAVDLAKSVTGQPVWQ